MARETCTASLPSRMAHGVALGSSIILMANVGVIWAAVAVRFRPRKTWARRARCWLRGRRWSRFGRKWVWIDSRC